MKNLVLIFVQISIIKSDLRKNHAKNDLERFSRRLKKVVATETGEKFPLWTEKVQSQIDRRIARMSEVFEKMNDKCKNFNVQKTPLLNYNVKMKPCENIAHLIKNLLDWTSRYLTCSESEQIKFFKTIRKQLFDLEHRLMAKLSCTFQFAGLSLTPVDLS